MGKIIERFTEFEHSTLGKIIGSDTLELSNPETIAAADKFADEMLKHYNGPFDAARVKLEKEIDKLQSDLASVQKGLTQAGALIATENFGFDPKTPDGKKKRERAHSMFKKFFSDAKRTIDAETKALAELENHVKHINGYKPRHSQG